MTAAASSVSSTQHVQSPISKSLTELCLTGSPNEVLIAIEHGIKPDQKTLESALKRLQQARQRCGSFDPSCEEYVSDEVSANFYNWLSVVEKLIEQNAPATMEANCIANTIGRGLDKKLLKQEKTSKGQIEKGCEKFCATTRQKIENLKSACNFFKAGAKKILSKFRISRFDSY